ncbi:MAG: signal recognition particle protein [Candidatus Omnitrophica bacterium]|nr:signal recognition particle protein [Candidatus Omnitrophota bacterium]
MFDSLQTRLGNLFRSISGQARMTEANIEEALDEVRVAMLDADVSYRATRKFINHVKERAVGQEVLRSLTPGQQVIKIVHEELINLMGGGEEIPTLPRGSRQAVMLMGLQGSGKTTTAAKLASFYKKEGRRPLLVAADVYRPAAIDQLRILADSIEVPIWAPGANVDPVEIASGALAHADREVLDTVILDTAGRLHVDDEMMGELERIRDLVKPHWRLFVADAMTGQDATQQAEVFHEKIGIDGVILTKLDGDTRGGAAISVRAVTGKPILFAGMGEKIDNFEVFYPDRMASRILGMGDVLSLIEKAESAYTEEETRALSKKIRKDEFDFNDFLDQIHQIRKMGGVRELLSLLPGFGTNAAVKNLDMGDKELVRVEAIVLSMTRLERMRPRILTGSRRRRIAAGSGTTVQDVNRLLGQFEQMKKMMKKSIGSKFTPSAKDRKKRAKAKPKSIFSRFGGR